MALPIIAALAAPIIGGAMSLVGGGLSVTGGVINAGATVAGIAARAASGVIGAVGGLMGGGQSGMVKSKAGKEYDVNSPQGKTIVTANKARKARESKSKSSKGGMSLAKVKPVMKPMSSKLGSVKSGSMPEVATGHESESTILSQILTQMGTNTGILTAMLNVLSTPSPEPVSAAPVIISPPEDLIGDSKKVKGDNDDGSTAGSKVKRVFGAVGEKLKSLSSSLGGTAKFLMKGLLGGAALIGFIKYRDNITSFIARTFEMLEGFGSKFADDEDPLGKFFDALTGTGEGSIISSLKKGLAFVIEELVYAMKMLVNEFRPGTFIIGKQGYNTSADTNLTNQAEAVGGAENLGTVSQGINPFTDKLVFKGMGGDANQQLETEEMVRAQLEMMYQNVVASGGRVQWTNIGDGFSIDGGVESLIGSTSIADIMSSQPIIDGKVGTKEDLNKALIQPADLGITSPALKEKYLGIMTSMTQNQQMFTANSKLQANNPGMLERTTRLHNEKMQQLEIQKKALIVPQSASLGNNGNINLVESGAKIGTVNTGDNVAMASRVDHTDPTQQALQQLIA